MSSFILSVRELEEDQFATTIGKISYLIVPDDAKEPRPSHGINNVNIWLGKVSSYAYPNPYNQNTLPLDIVFFVHGYNTSPEEALVRQRLVEAELRLRGLQCMVIGFDWPTGGKIMFYEYDRLQALEAATMLVKDGIIPFYRFTSQECRINIHVIAHSMGAFVVREAFRAIDKARDTNRVIDWRIGQLVLFAADISSDCFEQDHADMVSVFNHCGRLTNYFSGYDKALAVANIKNLDISSRAGRVGMPDNMPAHEKAVDVDCSQRYLAVPETERENFRHIDGMVSHSWYLEDPIWYDDLAYTLKGQIDRNLIPTRSIVSDNYFKLKEQPN